MKITKITLRFPSKTIQYGYAEAEVEFSGDWHTLGYDYRQAVMEFQRGETLNKESKPASNVVVDPAELIKSELGATDITDVMNEDIEEDSPEWESEPAPPKPSDDDWDF